MFGFMRFCICSQEMSVFSGVKIFLCLVPGPPHCQQERYIFGMLHVCEPLTQSYILFENNILLCE